eukprot:CAMPEP_0197497834 /NCGR_PEP_ID=MMETSP1311-20131121/54160_1 /TAXON_ID=464262 /ORGANISM="Genus nov. species nov., Strain RCC856" /LENGTH=61 /DNA_ID=CAMNT_0043043525 /DNA_START=326 /DNA_END=507 /DNA_ORIENTATION=-
MSTLLRESMDDISIDVWYSRMAFSRRPVAISACAAASSAADSASATLFSAFCLLSMGEPLP